MNVLFATFEDTFSAAPMEWKHCNNGLEALQQHMASTELQARSCVLLLLLLLLSHHRDCVTGLAPHHPTLCLCAPLARCCFSHCLMSADRPACIWQPPAAPPAAAARSAASCCRRSRACLPPLVWFLAFFLAAAAASAAVSSVESGTALTPPQAAAGSIHWGWCDVPASACCCAPCCAVWNAA